MFRVTKGTAASRVVITVDGELCNESVEVVESICGRELKVGNAVDLVLRDLTSIDREGRALLERLMCRGVHLEARGVYNSYLVQALRKTAASGEIVQGKGLLLQK